MLAAGQWSAAISRSYTLQSLSGRAVVCCSRPIVSCCIPVYSSLVPSAARRTFPCVALRSSRLASSLSSRDADAAPFEPAPTALSTVYVAIGSNMEPRFPSLLSAVSKINDLSSTKVLRTSYLYESLPMYITDQASFLNACLKVTTSLPPHTLLKELKKIESIVGRRPTVKNGPRLIDLDILLVEDEGGKSVPVNINEGSETESLIVPHPRIAER
jgi:2-amino-4-hydroxy-6-hydroxymethyldihydropteridine diphosphokinase